MSSHTVVRPSRQARRRQKRDIREFLQIRCSLRWVGMGIGVSSLLTLLAYRSGKPAAMGLGTAAMAGIAYSLIEPAFPVLERVTVTLPTLPAALDGLRIGQMSDLHLSRSVQHAHAYRNTRWAVQQMVREQPDLIAITGDFVSSHDAINDLPEVLRPLQAPLGVYAITGNHDYWEGVDDIQTALEALGIRLLLNEHTRLSWRGSEVWLVGLDDMWYGVPDLKAALTGIPADACTVLLAHEPDFADVASQRHVALQLSGHTHGGHVNLPVLGTPCLPRHGFYYVKGLHQVGAMQVYVSRGLGGYPIRVNCPPEATILTLRRKDI